MRGKNLYKVQASVDNIIVWQFSSVVAFDKSDAIDHCIYTMKHIMGNIPDTLVWHSESEWENNLNVN